VDVLSTSGGPVALAHGVQVQTQALPQTLADYAAVILPGFLAEDLPTLMQQLHSVWQPVLEQTRRFRNSHTDAQYQSPAADQPGSGTGMGRSPGHKLAEEGSCLSDTRLSSALGLLLSTAQPVTQIALSCGYQTPSHIAARFRQRFDFSPSAIRRKGTTRNLE
jgi:hypothetical protein